MSLFEELTNAKSEEDVKDIYIRYLHLKDVTKGLVDIKTKQIWFEAKLGHKVSTYEMFTQLLFYVAEAIDKPSTLFYEEVLPPFLCVIDSGKAAIMETKIALPLLQDKSTPIKWGKSASDVTQDALEVVSQFIGTHFVSFRIETQEKEFISTIKKAIQSGAIVRTQITPDNLKQVFDRWIDLIGKEISGVEPEKYCLLFFADIMSDGTVSTHENLPAELLHKNGRPVFSLEGKLYQLGNYDGYRKFWAIYNRPPEEEYRNYLLERRDSLIPTDERSFKGAYYTPLHVVEKAYEYLNRTLGKNWQKDYIVWDMCCGVGNLETKHSNHRNIYMSTLDQADIDVMKAAKTCCAATRFQYDYLNDDIKDDGTIDYTLTNKIPEGLRKAIKESAIQKTGGGNSKKILVLINPPYAEATNADNTAKGAGEAENKTGVAKTKFAAICMDEYGKASNELFTQFVARVAKEIPNATIAMFSKLKYVNSTNFEEFRNKWNANYLDGFIIHSKAFESLKGDFPIGFLIWKTNNFPNANKTPITEISCEVFEKDGTPIGEKKFYNLSTNNYLNVWIKRPRANKTEVVPLSNSITVSPMEKPRVKTWFDNAIGYMCSGTNDMQNAANYTFLLSSVAGRGNGFYVTEENLEKATVIFTAQKIIPHTWQNDRDQFLQPNCELPKEFKNDCLVWMLFNGSNLTAGADNLIWNNREWSITNHFIPFTEEEVNAPDRFESDFMVQYMSDKTFSEESKAVLQEGKKLWTVYFSTTDEHSVRDRLKLNRTDAGWYQIRNALKARNESGETAPISFTSFEETYKILTDKLRPQVYKYGFLR